jgi:hypoxanthine-DNA glycosylase
MPSTPFLPHTLSPAAAAAPKRCFDPVIDAHTRLLVLGSLPGEQSLALQQYYGNRQNKFWALMSAVLDVELVPLAYPTRLAQLLAHGVGLWDVVAQAQRQGSLDSNIRQRDDNDLPALLARYPAIGSLAFNGGTAARLGQKVLGERASHYRIIELPSSSPAYTLAYADKLARWLALRPALHA